MAIIKCKMCGGSLDIQSAQTTAVCEYCGTAQTLPKLTDDKRTRLYDRAGHFRRNNDFDKAASIYEEILNEDNSDAEAYWSLVLCSYGIEYVEHGGNRVPTVNRAQFTSIFDDDNYKMALTHADPSQKAIYETEAKQINEIQKGILAISQKEAPFDVFICYKEKDANGERTRDSVIAQDLYYQLTEAGFKVFFARITLEDKLGVAYEPYIFAALNSSKVMVALGTKPEHFNAVWVKNEWSRYLALVKKSNGKKMLIPAYRDMDAYDLPEEFSHLQAQDMSRLGFMQDLIRGIQKIIPKNAPASTPVSAPVAAKSAGGDVATLLKRVSIFIEGGDWSSADIYCEKALDIDPENAQAYLYKLMVRARSASEADLANSSQPLSNLIEYKNAIRFSDEDTSSRLVSYNNRILRRLEEEEKRRQQQQRLEAARSNAQTALTALVQEKEQLEHRIQETTSNAQHQNPEGLRKHSIAVIIMWVIGFFIFMISVSSGSEPTVFFIYTLVYLFVSRSLTIKSGQYSGHSIINAITWGIYGLVIAISTYNKSKKLGNAATAELQMLRSELATVNSRIDEVRQSLLTLNSQN